MLDVAMRETRMSAHLAYMNKTDAVAIGKRIKRARQAAKVGQAAMGRKLGVTAVTVLRWEKGEVTVSVSRLRQIAELLGTPIEELVPSDELETSEPPADDPEEYIRLAQLSLAVAHSRDEDARRELDEIVVRRYRRLRGGRPGEKTSG